MEDKDALLHPMLFSNFFLAFFLCLAAYGNLNILSDDELLLSFWEHISSEAYMEFVFIGLRFFIFFFAAAIEVYIGYFLIRLVYCVLLRLFYSKPCRIYPVEKEHIFTLR